MPEQNNGLPAIVRAAPVARDAAKTDRVVLFVHGAGTPGAASFDVPFQDHSWMAHLARAGFDVFAMDMTGYGKSTRPLAMNDPCHPFSTVPRPVARTSGAMT
ncbi:MAG: alpha/beta fold hydrolase [Acetobacteraceae bacterium]|nr:alpha/beta fold hydrolase [Acetobacteraceae bacterium]